MMREVDEEIGYETDKIVLIDGMLYVPGGSSEVITIYYCEVSKQSHVGGGLEDEDIDLLK